MKEPEEQVVSAEALGLIDMLDNVLCSRLGIVRQVKQLNEEEVLRYRRILNLAVQDVLMLIQKGNSYGESWYKRGGVGGFFMLSRKWDRLEVVLTKRDYGQYDIVKAMEEEFNFNSVQLERSAETVIDTVQDLRGYLLLTQEKALDNANGCLPLEKSGEEAGPSYTNQDK